jgi:16S rRNA (guanine527-N7)-methyltransferase
VDDATRRLLQLGIAELGTEVTPTQVDQLLAYLALLVKWNGAYNLTAVRDPSAMVARHLLDSLAVAPLLQGERFIDVGTGAGLPGVPLAIVRPDVRFELLDSNGKKTRFLFQVKTALALDTMAVHQARVESFKPPGLFDAVLSRAFASLGDMINGCRHLIVPGGRFLAMKGQYPEAELAALDADVELLVSHRLQIPGLAEERHLLELGLRRRQGLETAH